MDLAEQNSHCPSNNRSTANVKASDSDAPDPMKLEQAFSPQCPECAQQKCIRTVFASSQMVKGFKIGDIVVMRYHAAVIFARVSQCSREGTDHPQPVKTV